MQGDYGAAEWGVHANAQDRYQNMPWIQGPGQLYPDSNKFAFGTPFAHPRRRRLNLLAIATCFFVPWVFFTLLYAIITFSVHYNQPLICGFSIFAAALIVLAAGWVAFNQMRRKAQGDPTREPTWFIFLFLTLVLAWIGAVAVGEINYELHTKPYLDIINLHSFQDVNTTRLRGEQLMDAGRVVFSEGTLLDTTRSMGFKNDRLYCVAPIISGPEGTVPNTYDFWAVGTDCCSGAQADFHCTNFNNPRAHSGVRLMQDGDRAFYRLAVQQAEATYRIRATHPLFFTWTYLADEELESLHDQAFMWFLAGMCTHFILQLLLVVCATLGFSKLGYM